MKHFFRLKFGDKFVVNGVVYQKENFFCGVRSYGTRELSWGENAPLYQDFWPWKKVSVVQEIAPTPVFASPPPLGERVLRDCPLKYQPHEDDNRTGPSA